jgi:hypothetical protein
MSDNSQQGRRDFLKTAAVGVAGAVGLTTLRFDRAHAQATGGWVNGMQINPAIDNKRVVCCHDTKMVTATPANTTWANQNANVDAKRVSDNLDQMAMLLTGKTTALAAWSTIFQFGSKAPASIRVAMKANGIGSNTTNRPRTAIYKKICDVLVDQLGVLPANIILYDACDDASVYYTVSPTDSTQIRAATVSVRAGSLGGFKAVAIANARAANSISCPADLVDGKIDILVNVAACKSHFGTGNHFNYGSCTLCMKNHFGTFTDGTKPQWSNNLHVPNDGATPPPPPLALFEINKHPAILGGSPVRQQICIVDALFSNGSSGPGGGFDNRTDRLVMGTFAPIVDYFSVKNILLNTTVMASSAMPALGVTNAATIVPLFLTSFGYAVDTVGSWIEYDPNVGVPDAGTGSGGASGSGGTSGTGGKTGSGGANASGGAGSGGAGSGGASGTGGKTGSGGASGTGGAGSGGASGSGGAGSGGASGSGGAGSGGASGTGGAGSGGASGTGGAGSGGGSGTGGAGSGGTTTAGGTTTSSGGSANTGGAPTSMSSVSGGAAASSGASAITRASSGSGCNVGGLGRKATPWAAMLGLGAVVAGKLRRLIIGGGDSDQRPHTP